MVLLNYVRCIAFLWCIFAIVDVEANFNHSGGSSFYDSQRKGRGFVHTELPQDDNYLESNSLKGNYISLNNFSDKNFSWQHNNLDHDNYNSTSNKNLNNVQALSTSSAFDNSKDYFLLHFDYADLITDDNKFTITTNPSENQNKKIYLQTSPDTPSAYFSTNFNLPSLKYSNNKLKIGNIPNRSLNTSPLFKKPIQFKSFKRFPRGIQGYNITHSRSPQPPHSYGIPTTQSLYNKAPSQTSNSPNRITRLSPIYEPPNHSSSSLKTYATHSYVVSSRPSRSSEAPRSTYIFLSRISQPSFVYYGLPNNSSSPLQTYGTPSRVSTFYSVPSRAPHATHRAPISISLASNQMFNKRSQSVSTYSLQRRSSSVPLQQYGASSRPSSNYGAPNLPSTRYNGQNSMILSTSSRLSLRYGAPSRPSQY